MSCTATNDADTATQVRILSEEYQYFIERLRPRWLKANNRPPNIWVLYETDPKERERVDGVIRRWAEYITPIAERWWERRGFGIVWPKDSSKPCQIYKLTEEPA